MTLAGDFLTDALGKADLLPSTERRSTVAMRCRWSTKRGSIYYLARAVSSADLTIIRRIDELHLLYPFAGSRMLRDLL